MGTRLQSPCSKQGYRITHIVANIINSTSVSTEDPSELAPTGHSVGVGMADPRKVPLSFGGICSSNTARIATGHWLTWGDLKLLVLHTVTK